MMTGGRVRRSQLAHLATQQEMVDNWGEKMKEKKRGVRR